MLGQQAAARIVDQAGVVQAAVGTLRDGAAHERHRRRRGRLRQRCCAAPHKEENLHKQYLLHCTALQQPSWAELGFVSGKLGYSSSLLRCMLSRIWPATGR